MIIPLALMRVAGGFWRVRRVVRGHSEGRSRTAVSRASTTHMGGYSELLHHLRLEPVTQKAGVMAKPVNPVRYDMASFFESCVEAYCSLAKVDQSLLEKLATPFTEAGIARPTLDENEKPGRLQPIASKVLMKILFAARMARFDLLRATQSLASRVTNWSAECDIALHRLVAYINCSREQFLEGFIGDDFKDCQNCQLWLFADADHAGEHDSKSTTGSAIILVGPNTYYPLSAFPKKQSGCPSKKNSRFLEKIFKALKKIFKETRKKYLVLVPWSSGPLVLWSPGPLVLWSPGPLVP